MSRSCEIARENKRLTVNDVVEFVLNNRGTTNAFSGWTPDEIAWSFFKAFQNNCAAYSINPIGVLTGVAIGDVDHDYKVFHVGNILVIDRPKALKQLLIKLLEVYPGYDIQATRRGNIIRYKNKDKLVSKILKLK